MTNNSRLYEEGLPVSVVYEEGANGIFLRQADGAPLSKVGVRQRAVRALKQANGELESRHPKGWPELHMDDGSVGVIKIQGGPILIHPEAVKNSEEWRRTSPATFTQRGPRKGKPKVDKPYKPKSKQVREWLKDEQK